MKPRNQKRSTGAAPRRTKVPSEGLAFVRGKVVELRKATVPLSDRGYLLGDGVFETLRTSGGRLFRLDDHMARLERGLRVLGLDGDLLAAARGAVGTLTKKGLQTFGDELYVRVMVTTGPMQDVAGSDGGVTVTGLCKKFKPYPMQYYARGIHVVEGPYRKNSTDPTSSVKTLSFLPYIATRRFAHSQTAHDAILLNEHGRVAEASTSNVFAKKGDTVYAPGAGEGAIPGVTRQAVVEFLDDMGVRVEEKLTVQSLREADEAWLTNTTGGIVPVTRFAERPIGNGKKGDTAADLGHALQAAIRNHA